MSKITRNPKWTRDEIILALDLYIRSRGNPPGKSSREVLELSGLINTLNVLKGVSGGENFRNPDGVYMKMMNFRKFDSKYEGAGLTSASKLDEATWVEFDGRPKDLEREADQIRLFILSGEAAYPTDVDEIDDPDHEADESGYIVRVHKSRERSAALTRRKKEQVLKQEKRLACEVCSFDFEAAYGELGASYIECHHTKPVAELKPGETTKLSELALVCSNCHRMIHRRRPMLSIEELRGTLSR